MEPYKTVATRVDIVNEVKKSKFIGIIFPCNTVQAFEKMLIKIKEEYKNASHYCYAYRIQENIVLERYQDDKEPSGTAGVPILEVLKGHKLFQCGVIVVRYFGGTKLGTGGLSRAYSDGARDAVEKADMVLVETAHIMRVEAEYSFGGKIEHYIAKDNIALMETIYTDNVSYTLALKEAQIQDVCGSLADLTGGQVKTEIIRKENGYFQENEFVTN